MLRITGDMPDVNCRADGEISALAADALRFARQAREMGALLREIRKNAEDLRALFWSDEETAEIRGAEKTFDAKMQIMVCTTFANLENYQLSGWKELLDNGEQA